ncbi:MAG: SDR family oxidoreductase [Rhizobiaceae bacterium]|nr:SDR family oxidoreductase [Rhizobiaceae bacterium]
MSDARTAIVTGGTRGIGAAISRRLCADGFRVIATFRTGLDAAHRLRDELGGALSVEAVDGGDARAVADFVAGLGDRKIDLLVNNAGISHAALASKATGTEAEAVFRTNLFQAVHYVGAVLPLMMRRRSGDIVMISSLAAGNVRSGNCLYGASKAALERYALGVAQEAARFNVAVNVISPGFVRTELSDALLSDGNEREIRASLPSRRLTEPDEVAESVAYLVSRKPMLVGAVLPVGGGGQL